MNRRVEGLRARLKKEGFDAILISQAENRRYLSGFSGSAGFLLISGDAAFIATDARYTEQAGMEAPGFELFEVSSELPKWFSRLAAKLDIKTVCVEAHDLSAATYRKLAGAGSGKELVPTEGMVESLRAVKDAQELELIQSAVDISDAAFEEVAPSLRPGMTERQAAWELEKAMRQRGSQSLPFDIIVASGPNAALPHHQPGERQLQDGEPLIIDMGARSGGYVSDLSRTICPGKESHEFAKIYDLVLGAQLTAIATIEAGMSGGQADRLARTVIDRGGYGDSFGHGLGHGVGLAPHESPRLGRDSSDILAEGMVFTVEPGIYVSGWGGVRIEDVVLLEEGRPRVLSAASK